MSIPMAATMAWKFISTSLTAWVMVTEVTLGLVAPLWMMVLANLRVLKALTICSPRLKMVKDTKIDPSTRLMYRFQTLASAPSSMPTTRIHNNIGRRLHWKFQFPSTVENGDMFRFQWQDVECVSDRRYNSTNHLHHFQLTLWNECFPQLTINRSVSLSTAIPCSTCLTDSSTSLFQIDSIASRSICIALCMCHAININVLLVKQQIHYLSG